MGLVFLELPRTFLEPYPYELLSRHKPMNAKCKIYSQKCIIKMHTYRLQMSEMHMFKTFHKGFNFC